MQVYLHVRMYLDLKAGLMQALCYRTKDWGKHPGVGFATFNLKHRLKLRVKLKSLRRTKKQNLHLCSFHQDLE